MVSIEWKDICYSVGDKHILTNVSGKVDVSDTLALLGPSGSGKTSLMNVLAGKVRPNRTTKLSGSIILNGEVSHDAAVWAFAPALQLMSLVEQYDLLVSMVTLHEHMSFHARLRLWDLSAKQREERIDAVLSRLRLLEHKGTLLPKLSGGQKKRVSVAEELLNNPEILVLDEPTSGLDSTMAREVVEILYNRGCSMQGSASSASSATQNEKTSVAQNVSQNVAQSVSQRKSVQSSASHVEFDKTGNFVKVAAEEDYHVKTTILFCIHQPSSHVYSMFSNVMFLAQGHLIYYGQGEGVVQTIERRLNVKCPEHYNGAEFALDTINDEEKVKQLVENGASMASKADSTTSPTSRPQLPQLVVVNGEVASNNSVNNSEDSEEESDEKQALILNTADLSEILAAKKRAPWCVEYLAIAKRTLLDRARNVQNTRLSLLSATLVCLLVGSIYFRMPRTPTSKYARTGAMMVIMMMPLYSV